MRLPCALAATTALCTALMACTVGPDFLRPDAPKAMSFLPDAPTEFVAGDIPGGEAQSLVQSMDIPGQWWSVFQSPQLNGLIETALRANPDIKAAVAGLKQAREYARAQRATMFPTLQAGLGASQNQTPASLSPATASGALIYGLFTVGLTLTYNLDLWGGNRRQIESLDALAEAQCFQLEGAYLSLASNVVAAAILEASLRAQVEATQRIIAAQRETLHPAAQTGWARFPVAMCGCPAGGARPPRQSCCPAEGAGAVAQSSRYLDRPISDQNLVEHHPGRPRCRGNRTAQPAVRWLSSGLDVRAARPICIPPAPRRRRHRQPTAEHHLEPRPQHSSHSAPTRCSGRPTGNTVGASLLQTIFDGGARRQRAAQAGLEQADAQYRLIVLSAFRNVADALRALEYRCAGAKASVDARAAATSLEIARRRLELGDTTYVVVLLAELTYQQALLGRVQAQANRYTDTAALFQALGGGWWNRDMPEPDTKAGPPRCRPPPAVRAPTSTVSQR